MYITEFIESVIDVSSLFDRKLNGKVYTCCHENRVTVKGA